MANEIGLAEEYIEYPWNWWQQLKDIREDYYKKFGI